MSVFQWFTSSYQSEKLKQKYHSPSQSTKYTSLNCIVKKSWNFVYIFIVFLINGVQKFQDFLTNPFWDMKFVLWGGDLKFKPLVKASSQTNFSEILKRDDRIAVDFLLACCDIRLLSPFFNELLIENESYIFLLISLTVKQFILIFRYCNIGLFFYGIRFETLTSNYILNSHCISLTIKHCLNKKISGLCNVLVQSLFMLCENRGTNNNPLLS